jgi:hypothetical protein
MIFELSFYGSLCATCKFVINGINADEEDFGEKYDRDTENAENYACGDMQFTRIAPTKKVLKKYAITKDEYSQICGKLEDGLSFGCCGWCV